MSFVFLRTEAADGQQDYRNHGYMLLMVRKSKQTTSRLFVLCSVSIVFVMLSCNNKESENLMVPQVDRKHADKKNKIERVFDIDGGSKADKAIVETRIDVDAILAKTRTSKTIEMALAHEIVAMLAEEKRIEIDRLGTMIPRNYSSYLGRNPRNGDTVYVPPSLGAFFMANEEVHSIDNTFPPKGPFYNAELVKRVSNSTGKREALVSRTMNEWIGRSLTGGTLGYLGFFTHIIRPARELRDGTIEKPRRFLTFHIAQSLQSRILSPQPDYEFVDSAQVETILNSYRGKPQWNIIFARLAKLPTKFSEDLPPTKTLAMAPSVIRRFFEDTANYHPPSLQFAPFQIFSNDDGQTCGKISNDDYSWRWCADKKEKENPLLELHLEGASLPGGKIRLHDWLAATLLIAELSKHDQYPFQDSPPLFLNQRDANRVLRVLYKYTKGTRFWSSSINFPF